MFVTYREQYYRFKGGGGHEEESSSSYPRVFHNREFHPKKKNKNSLRAKSAFPLMRARALGGENYF